MFLVEHKIYNYVEDYVSSKVQILQIADNGVICRT